MGWLDRITLLAELCCLLVIELRAGLTYLLHLSIELFGSRIVGDEWRMRRVSSMLS